MPSESNNFLCGLPAVHFSKLNSPSEVDYKPILGLFMRILRGSLWELWNLSRSQAGLMEVSLMKQSERFLDFAIQSFSDIFFTIYHFIFVILRSEYFYRQVTFQRV